MKKENFWKKLKKSFSVLAPMYDVTDVAFRELLCETAKPDVMFTEFVSTEAFVFGKKDQIYEKLKKSESQRPIVAQIWGIDPQNYLILSKEIKSLGFDGVDINMGCPQKPEMKAGACAALINNPTLAKEIILATKEGAGNLPVSVKTRAGVSKPVLEEWLPFLLEQDLSAITLHARTAKQLSKVPAAWHFIKKAVDLKNQMKKDTVIIGNGDVQDVFDGENKCNEFGCDGYMIGRGVFQNPYCFSKELSPTWQATSKEKKMELLKKHLILWQKLKNNPKTFNALKKFFKIYINGFDNASETRMSFMEVENIDDALRLIKQIGQS